MATTNHLNNNIERFPLPGYSRDGEPATKRPRLSSSDSSEPYSDSSSDDDCDLSRWIDSLPRIESSKEYKPVPTLLGQRIHELCDEHGVKMAEWIQNSTDWKTILVLGEGANNEQLAKQLRCEVEDKFSDFKIDFVECEGSHIKRANASKSWCSVTSSHISGSQAVNCD